MDRHTLAQLVAMLVVLSLLVRWLPAANARPGEAPELDSFGRGEPWLLLEMDRRSLREGFGSDRVLAKMLGSTRRELYTPRWHQMLGLIREIQAGAAPDDVVQLSNCSRNELWMFTYYLYPLQVVGLPREDGDLPVQAEADWVLRAGDLVMEGRKERSEPATLERRR
jgi:hypothetical protein